MQDEILQKNKIYDQADSAVWQLAVYAPVHDGWEFTNMGGTHVLDFVGEYARLDQSKRVLEFCCGLGDTCRYLAKKFGCRVTGVDMNVHQVNRAQAKLARREPALANRIDFIHSDVLRLSLERRYDAAYLIDSLMLIDNTLAVFKKLREMLKPNGRLVLAEMVAGPNITSEATEYAREEDGIVSLPTPAGYESTLAAAGFQVTHVEDITGLAENCFEKIRHATLEQETAITAAAGSKVHQNWVELSCNYWRYFHERQFAYCLIAAECKRPLAENQDRLAHFNC